MQKTNQKRNLFPLFLYICPEPVAIKDQAMANGTLIHQWDFHAGDTQIWDIELYNGGPYYTIASTASSSPIYYLAVQNDVATAGASIVLRYGTVVDYILWDISCNVRTGNAIIKPKLALPSNLVMCSPSSNVGNNAEVSLYSYTDNDAFMDEWVLFPYEGVVGTLSIGVFADEAYTQQHSDYESRIENIMLQVRAFYFTNFGIDISCSSVNLHSEFTADACNADGGSQSCYCTSEDCGDTHHKSNEVYSREVEAIQTDYATTLVFSGHELCEGTLEEHEPYSVYGFAWANKYACITSSNMPIENEIKTTAHEIGHWFGVKDHYDTIPNDGDTAYTLEEIHNMYEGRVFHGKCIHGTEKDSLIVVNSLIICSGCKLSIQGNATQFGGFA